MQLFEVQAAVANQFAAQQQHRNFVPIARPRGGLQIDIDNINRDALR